MPKRTRRVNTTFLTDPLYASLEAYTKEHPLPHFTECVVCFSHVFDRTLSTRRVRDYDNLECKQILDTVSGFLMTDDSGLFCDAYHTTEFGERDCTVLTVMEKMAFPGWLAEVKNRGNSISDFRLFSRNFPTMVKRLPNPQNLRQIPCPRPPAFYRSFRRVW